MSQTDSTAPASAGSIHGHEIIHLIHEASPPFTRQTLSAEVSRRFGPEPRFHTCSAGAMTLEELLAFLMARQKVVERDGQLGVMLQNVCGHGDDHHHD